MSLERAQGAFHAFGAFTSVEVVLPVREAPNARTAISTKLGKAWDEGVVLRRRKIII